MEWDLGGRVPTLAMDSSQLQLKEALKETVLEQPDTQTKTDYMYQNLQSPSQTMDKCSLKIDPTSEQW